MPPLVPLSATAQSYYLSYNMIVGSIQSDTQNITYYSGEVQTTNLLTANLSGPGSIANASAIPTATFGLLQLTASCSDDDPTDNGNGYLARFVGGQDVLFADTLTPTSTTLSLGFPVLIQIACVYNGYISSGASFTDAYDGTTANASVGLVAYANAVNAQNSVTGGIGSVNQTNIISVIVKGNVGTAFNFIPAISASGVTDNDDAAAFIGFVNTVITSQTYVTVLTPGAGYTSASGTVYPTLALAAPVLSIQSSSNQTAVVSWPFVYANYVLQQNTAPNTTGWLLNSNSVSEVNGTNQVTVSTANNSMFYRLALPQ